jgi:hypothetical protein
MVSPVAGNLAAPARLGAVDVGAFSCTRRLSGFGAGTMRLMLPSGIPAERLLRFWSWRVWAFYGDPPRPYWCGVPTGAQDEGGPSVTLTLTEITGYLRKRQWDIGPPNRRYNQVEQTVIARDIAAPLADLGAAVSITTDPGPGFPRDREYEYLEGESRANLLENLSQVIGGPEFRTDYYMAASGIYAGRPAAALRIGYPRVGAEAAEGGADLGLTVPGEAIGYGATWDSDHMRTRTFAAGDLPEDAPEGTRKPVVVVDRPQNDLPRLDEVDDYPGVILTSTLTERGNAEATRQADPALRLAVTAPEAAPPIWAYGPGDDVTVRVVTPLMPEGLAVDGRLTGVEVDAATGKVTWEVVISLPPPRARYTLTGRLGTLERITRGVFRRGAEAI